MRAHARRVAASACSCELVCKNTTAGLRKRLRAVRMLTCASLQSRTCVDAYMCSRHVHASSHTLMHRHVVTRAPDANACTYAHTHDIYTHTHLMRPFPETRMIAPCLGFVRVRMHSNAQTRDLLDHAEHALAAQQSPDTLALAHALPFQRVRRFEKWLEPPASHGHISRCSKHNSHTGMPSHSKLAMRSGQTRNSSFPAMLLNSRATRCKLRRHASKQAATCRYATTHACTEPNTHTQPATHSFEIHSLHAFKQTPRHWWQRCLRLLVRSCIASSK